MDKAFAKVGGIIRKIDKGLMNLSDKTTKDTIGKSFGDGS
jgi:hypothetical protein